MPAIILSQEFQLFTNFTKTF